MARCNGALSQFFMEKEMINKLKENQWFISEIRSVGAGLGILLAICSPLIIIYLAT